MTTHKEVILEFEKILSEENIPKNIKNKVTDIVSTLNEETDEEFKTNKALQELDEISEENNIPEHIRTQIWGIVSLLESLK